MPSTSDLAPDESAGMVWPPAVICTCSLPSTVAVVRANLLPPASTSVTATSARLVAPPGVPVVEEWPVAATDPIFTAPPRIERFDARDAVAASRVSRTGRARESEAAEPTVTTGARAAVGPPGASLPWAWPCSSTSGPAAQRAVAYPVGGTPWVSPWT